jgi:hypothetical protein
MTEKELASRQKQESKRKLVKIKQASGCVDCGENNHIVLDFDHIKDKKYNISRIETVARQHQDTQVPCCSAG